MHASDAHECCGCSTRRERVAQTHPSWQCLPVRYRWLSRPNRLHGSSSPRAGPGMEVTCPATADEPCLGTQPHMQALQPRHLAPCFGSPRSAQSQSYELLQAIKECRHATAECLASSQGMGCGLLHALAQAAVHLLRQAARQARCKSQLCAREWSSRTAAAPKALGIHRRRSRTAVDGPKMAECKQQQCPAAIVLLCHLHCQA